MRIFKKLNETDRAAEMKPPSEKELCDWVINMAKKREREISRAAVQFLLRRSDRDMNSLSNEIEKLVSLTPSGAEITREEIETSCAPALTARIFDLVGAVGNKEPERALDIFGDIILMKEQPLAVLIMIARQFRLMIQCKALSEKNRSSPEIASALNLRGFIVTECLRQSRLFSMGALLEALNACLDADIKIKSGRVSDKTAIEILIVKFAGRDFANA